MTKAENMLAGPALQLPFSPGPCPVQNLAIKLTYLGSPKITKPCLVALGLHTSLPSGGLCHFGLILCNTCQDCETMPHTGSARSELAPSL